MKTTDKDEEIARGESWLVVLALLLVAVAAFSSIVGA